MTSESESASASGSGRPPPTIELTATEVDPPTADSAKAKTESKTETKAKSATQEPSAASGATAKARVSPIAHAISAAVGAFAAILVLAGLWLSGFTLARDVVNSETGAAAPNAEIAARLDKIERALQTQRPDTLAPALGNRLAAVEMQAKMLGDSAAALNHRVDDIAAAAQAAQKQATSAASAAADAAKSAGQTSAQPADLDALTNRIAALEGTVKSLSEQIAHPVASADQAARLMLAAQALRTAVESGVPYQAELKAVQALGAAPSATAPLEAFAASGLPRPETLAHELATLIPALRAAANPTPADATFFDRLKANARKLVDITPVEAPPGNDPASVITRIDIDANRGDIGAGLKDIAVLPDQLKPLAADWARKAQAREAAIAASRDIAAAALASLSKAAAQ